MNGNGGTHRGNDGNNECRSARDQTKQRSKRDALEQANTFKTFSWVCGGSGSMPCTGTHLSWTCRVLVSRLPGVILACRTCTDTWTLVSVARFQRVLWSTPTFPRSHVATMSTSQPVYIVGDDLPASTLPGSGDNLTQEQQWTMKRLSHIERLDRGDQSTVCHCCQLPLH